MIEFRDNFAAELGVKLIVHSNTAALEAGANPFRLGTERCCGLLKTQSLLDALREGNYDAAFGGARRDEEKSRAKERIFSFRDRLGQWDPKNQRPELWNMFQQPRRARRKHPRVPAFQLDRAGRLAVHPRREHPHRAPVFRQGAEDAGARQFADHAGAGFRPAQARRQWNRCGAACARWAVRPAPARSAPMPIRVPKIIAELVAVRNSERENRVIDHDREGSMELKKREGYF